MPTEAHARTSHAAALAAGLREVDAPGAREEWLAYRGQCETLLRFLRMAPLNFPMTVGNALIRRGWADPEATAQARELCALPSRDIRLALEAERDLAQSHLDAMPVDADNGDAHADWSRRSRKSGY